jgi:hypothetical protein
MLEQIEASLCPRGMRSFLQGPPQLISECFPGRALTLEHAWK